MTTKGQNLRSSTPGQTPAAGTRAPGEIWLNFPDRQLGYIDASKNAQPVVAVRYFSTLANYAIGDYVIQSGQLYRALVAVTAGAFNLGQWTKILTNADLPPNVVPAMNDNRIINGDMRIDQRNNGASSTASSVYTIDRWQFVTTQTSKFNWGRQGPTSFVFPYFFGLNSTSAYTPLATDTFFFHQVIEADMVSDFQWGTGNAQPVTLSFWVNSSQGGTLGGALVNLVTGPPNTTRSYPFSYSLSANTWTRIVITIPGDTAGIWVMAGNAAGVGVRFDLGSGANLRAPAGAWANGSFVGANGAVNVCATNAANLTLTGVKLEIGSVATPYNRQSLAKSMADCQRYFQTGNVQQNVGGNSWIATWTNQHYFMLPVIMRATPTTASNISVQAIL